MARTLTLDDMLTRVSTDFLQDSSNRRWGTPQITRFINDAQADFARGSKVCRKYSSALSVAATTPSNAFYTLPADFIELEPGGVWDNTSGNNIRMWPIEVADLPNLWDTLTTSVPVYRYVVLEEFGATEMRVWPTPTSTLTGLKIYYAYLPADLTTGQTTPIPPQWHMALVYFAASQCFSLPGQGQQPAEAQRLMGMYERELADAVDAVSRRLSESAVYVETPHL